MGALAFAVEYDAIAEFLVAYALSETDPKLAAGRRGGLPASGRLRRMHRARNLDAGPYFLDMLVRNFGNKS
jgi:hypothetical protein